MVVCVCVCVCVCVYLLNCTEPRNPALAFKSFYATRLDLPKEGSMIVCVYVCVCVCVYLLTCT